jgi:uncharacterized SAM-binding protein YcdF (DUF218 family)
MHDVCIVLGGGVEHDKPSVHTKARLMEGIKLLKKRHAKFLMLTGSRMELNIMYTIASRHIDPNKIIVCKPSKTTIGNAYYAKLKAIEHQFKKLIVVTSNFHMERALAIFNLIFGDEYIIIGRPSNEDVESSLLEREKKLKIFLTLLDTFKKGDHETVMHIARLFKIED